MSEFDVKFRAYENAMHANNNFGLSGDALAQQYGRYTTGLQYDAEKAANKAFGREYGRALAQERAAARADYINFWQRELPKYDALRYAENASRPFSITASQIDNQFGLNRTPMTAAERADYTRFWQQNAPAGNAPAGNAPAGQTVKVLDAHGGCEYKGQKYATLAEFRANNPEVSIPQAELAKVTDPAQRTLVEQQKITNYRNAMKAQGMTGAELEEQVNRYKEGIKHDKRKAINKRKGEKIAKQKAAEAPKGAKGAKGAGKFGKFFKGKGGKIGLALGAAALIGGAIFGLSKCSDDKEAETPVTPTEPETPTTPAPVEEQPTPVEETPVTPAQPEQPVEPAQPVVDATGNIVQNGDSLEEIANRYGVTVEQLKELNADKIKKFQTTDGREIEGFLVGEDITLPEGTAKVEGLRNKEESISDYEEYLRQNLDNIPQTMWNQLCTPEFRRKNKIGEYKEAA